MATSLKNILAAINPSLYYGTSGDKSEAKKQLKEFSELVKKEGILKAAEKVKSPKALSEHNLVYQSYAESIEPVYFFIHDLMEDMGLKPEKLIDNFFSSPGSTQWQESGQRKGIMQQQAFKIMGDINMLLRSILNIVYDLRDFKIRLKMYDDVKEKVGNDKKAAVIALKQLWLDKVDAQKGRGGIHELSSGNLSFVTLRDAFFQVNSVEDIANLDLNERVKSVLFPRFKEFEIWVEQSEKELRKRYEIQRNYLKGQVSSIKLYSRWAKPYLVAASNLESEDISGKSALVKTFNRVVIEVILLGKRKYNPSDGVASGNLPAHFSKIKFPRDYYSCTLVSFTFTALPGQGNFVGKSRVNFSSYCLNEDELELFKESMNNSDLNDVLKLIEGATEESLKQLEKDIEEFTDEKNTLKDAGPSEENKKNKNSNDKNPFLALVGKYNDSPKTVSQGGFFERLFKKKEEEKKKGSIRKETWEEKEYLRKFAAEDAIETTFGIFNIYKKAHGMPSYI
jgi:hypothetical protein